MSADDDIPWTWMVDAAAMTAWVDALRDDNPIHRDAAAAAALGFGHRTVNPGPANLAYVLNKLAADRPDRYPMTVHATFLGNVLSGDVVEVTGGCDEDGTCLARLVVPARGEIALEVEVRAERPS